MMRNIRRRAARARNTRGSTAGTSTVRTKRASRPRLVTTVIVTPCRILFLILLSTLMVPFIVRLVPLFVMFQSVGWINTFLPLVVPAFFGTPLFIFLMRQFFLTIPRELDDAARIDGANFVRIFWNVLLPLSLAACGPGNKQGTGTIVGAVAGGAAE